VIWRHTLKLILVLAVLGPLAFSQLHGRATGLTPEQQQRVAALEARMRGVLEDAALSGQTDQKGGRSPPAGGRQP